MLDKISDEERFRSIIFNSVNINLISVHEVKYDMLLIVKHQMGGYRPAYVNKVWAIIDFRSHATLWNVEIDEIWLVDYDTDLGI